MRDHLAYLRYVLRHKWYVFHACLELRVPLHQAILHDWSKFLPSEWFAYVATFYAPGGSKRYIESSDFDRAWNRHQKIQPHHWQFWLLSMDSGTTHPLEMPERFVREMVADWVGAGLAITGKREVMSWYLKNRDKMQLHLKTRARVEQLLETQDSIKFARHTDG